MKKVTVKYGDIRNSQKFAMGLWKLTNTPFPTKIAYQITKIVSDIEKKIPGIQVEDKEMLSQFGTFDGTKFSPNPEKLPELNAAEKEFNQKTFELDRDQIPGYALEGQGAEALFTAAEVAALEGIVDFEAKPEMSASDLEIQEMRKKLSAVN